MSIEAMKQALEALGCIESPLQVWEINKLAGAMNALRQAIEQAEKQEPIGEIVQAFEDLVAVSIPVMPPVGTKLYTARVHASDIPPERVDETAKDRHEWAMQKMVDENQRLGLYDDEQPTCQENRQVAKSATTEWVGLTDGEMQEAMEYWSDSLRSSYGGAESASEEYVDMVLTWRYIEAKLKEKNHG
jgi:Mn-containing catalase